MTSLSDAIVMQNLSVLTRGNTLRHKVLLLGGPNTYLPFLRDCWRKRIPETWRDRGYAYPKDVPIEELIIVPENAQYYAAYGAVVYGLYENAEVGVYKGMDGLKDFILNGRAARLGETAGPPLLTQGADHGKAELDEFKKLYTIPKFQDATFAPGQVVKVVIGMDGGSTSSKAVLIDYDTGELLKKSYMLSKGNPIADTKEILAGLKKYITDQGAIMEVMGFGATGYAADVLKESVKSDTSHRRDGRPHDVGHPLLRRHRRRLRHRRAGHQGSVHAERRHPELPAVEPVLGRQRHAAAGDGRSVRRQGHRLRRRGLRGQAVAEVQLRLRRVPRLRPRELPEGRLLEGRTSGRPGAGPAEERLAVRRADPAHGGARQEVRAPGRHPAQPGRAEGAGRLHQGARSRRRGVRPPAHRRGRRHRRRHGDPSRGHAQGLLDLHRHRRRHQPEVPGGQRRVDALPLLPQQLRPHLHRHRDARRADLALHLRLLLREGDGRIGRGDDRAQQGAQEADEGVPEPGRLRVEAGLPALLRPGTDARGDADDLRRGGREDLPRA